jgi:hypothetical protein
MTDKESPAEHEDKEHEEFCQMADKFIQLANHLSENSSRETISSSMVYAAARFNAYLIASNTSNLDEMTEQKADAVKYFSQQYLDMFEENFEDYENNYDYYLE